MAEISKTADQALAALIMLSDRGPMNPAELARALELNRTVVHRLLSTLLRRGFVSRHADRYSPGAILVRMAERVQPGLRVAATPVMKDLARDIGETVVLHVAEGEDAVVLHQVVATDNVVRVEHQIGSRHSLRLGASGRALLAFLDAPVATRVTEKADAPEALRRQLESVRELGYSLSHDELQDGVYGLAVPVLAEPAGQAIASIAALAPMSRGTVLTQHTEALRAAAERIARACSELRTPVDAA
ncbi:IclR family transcriptional regulator [Pseudonocardia acaciae]|uniref:IclR family transcriptional regulator n=1 Tax=Pseudonocardia acaciae TaxID=551276 RepID=UPI000687D00C|nr:IclR family transcriptional regulator C-terminal domain-containing protein [Pseudonocardia acaciae]